MADFSYDEAMGAKKATPAGTTFSYEDATKPASPRAAEAAAHTGPLSNDTDESWLSGAAKGAGTAVIDGLSAIPGQFGGLRDLVDYGLARGESFVTGTPLEEVQSGQKQKRDAMRKGNEGSILGGAINATSADHIPSGADISAPIKSVTGEYDPESIWGRMAKTGLETAIAAPFSGGRTAAPRIGPVASPLSALRETATGAKSMTPAAISAGALGQGVTEVTGDPLLGMAAGMGVPAAGGALWDKASTLGNKATRIFRPSQHEDLAAEKLHGLASDPEAALANAHFQPNEIVPGSRGTLADVTGDRGFALSQAGAEAAAPDFAAKINEQRGAQNVARRAHVDEMAPTNADTLSPGQHLRNQVEELERSSQQRVDALASGRDQLHEAIPDAVPAEQSGQRLRDTLQAGDDAAGRQVSALYKAVDPEGRLAVVSAPLRDAAEVIGRDINPSVEVPSPLLAQAVERARAFPDVMAFGDYVKFDQTLSGLMRQARQTGDSGYAQLVQLKKLVKDNLANAVDRQHEYEQSQVQQGARAPENTLEARLAAQRDAFYANRQDTGAGVARDGSGRSGGVPAANRGQVQGGAGRGNAGGNRGVSGDLPADLVPNMDEATAGRLAAANEAHATRAQTYRDGPVGSVLDDNGYKGQYKTPDSGVPAKAFVKGDKGYETAQAHLTASNGAPQAVAALQDMAVTRLREAMADGPLTQRALDLWKQRHAGALRAIDEVSPGFSDRFNSAARATRIVEEAGAARAAAIDAAQSGAAGKLMGATHADEVRSQVGSILGAADGPTKMASLVERVQGNPDAIAGLRRAGVDAIINKASNAGTAGGESILSHAKIGKMVRENEGALTALYGQEGVANMRRVAADLERSQATADAARARTGSDTAKLQTLKKGFEHVETPATSLTDVLLSLYGGAKAGPKGMVAAGAGLIGKTFIGRLKAAGMNSVNDIVKEALLNPEVGRALLQRAIDAKGKVIPAKVNRFAAAVVRGQAAGAALQQPPDEAANITLKGYADGGKVEGEASETFMRDLIDQIAQRVRGGQGYANGGRVSTPGGLASLWTPPEDNGAHSPGPSEEDSRKISPAMLLQGAKDHFAAIPGEIGEHIAGAKDAYDGKFDPSSDEGVKRAMGTAGLAQLGGLGGGPAGGLGSGLIRPNDSRIISQAGEHGFFEPQAARDRDPRKWHSLSSTVLSRPLGEMTAEHEFTGPLSARTFVKPEDLEGAALIPALGDRTASGSRLTKINETTLASPVEMQGGHSFMFGDAARGPDAAAWASDPGVIKGLATKTKKAADAGFDPHLSYVAMGSRSGDYSHHMTDTLLGMLPESKLSKATVAEFDRQMRENGANKWDLYGDWPGLSSPKLNDYLYGEGPAKARTKMAELMGQGQFQKAGMPDVGAARFGITDPGLVHAADYSAGHSIAKLDPSGRIIQDAAVPHKTYKSQLGADPQRGYVGGFEHDIPFDVMNKEFIDRLNAENPGKYNNASQLAYTYRMHQPTVFMTPQVVDRLSGYLEKKKSGLSP